MDRLDAHARDEMSFHLVDNESLSFIFEAVSLTWDLLQPRQYEACQRLKALIARQLQFVLRLKIEYVDASIEEQRRARIDSGWRCRSYIELVFQLTHQLLEHIFDGDHTCRRTEFVHHHCQVPLALLEFT